MPSAVDFLPPNMSVFVNLVTSLSLNLGSGMIRRLGTSRRRGMAVLVLCSGSGGGRRGERPRSPRPGEHHALGRFTPYFERLRLRLTLFVDDGPMAPDASS